MKESGFTAYDFSTSWEGPFSELIGADDYKERAQELRAYADSIGIVCNQSQKERTIGISASISKRGNPT